MEREVRLRIAPSPTGNPHVGTAFIALFNMAFAKKHNGKLILRIEDTDQTRSHKKYEDEIIDLLSWVGIDWQEGPDKQSSIPYRQSERKDIYSKYIKDLEDKGHAYKCFCTEEDLALAKSINKQGGFFGYNGHCRHLSQEDVENNINNNIPYVIRLKTPTSGSADWLDLIKGSISFPYKDIDDQILIKSDGMPTYHFANVVDDYLMEITHVLRGDEWISSTPKHIYLYNCFGWEIPKFGHLPLLLGTDGKKLSKRTGHTSIDFYRKQGYLPEALFNFLSLISYSIFDGSEIYTKEKFFNSFDISKISKSSAVFDVSKLNWINKSYISATENKELLNKVLECLEHKGLNDMIDKAKMRSTHLTDIITLISPIITSSFNVNGYLIRNAAKSIDKSIEVLNYIESNLIDLDCWDIDTIKNIFIKSEEYNFKKDLMPILFLAIQGTKTGLPVFWAMEILGKKETLSRIEIAKLSLNNI